MVWPALPPQGGLDGWRARVTRRSDGRMNDTGLTGRMNNTGRMDRMNDTGRMAA